MKWTLVVVAALAAGCSANYPRTGAEFREATKNSSLVTRDSFEVKRSLDQVGRTWQRKAAECLNGRVVLQTRTNYGTTTTHHQHKGAATVTKESAELTFHVRNESMSNEPPDGVIFLVANAYPISRDTARVEIVRARMDLLAEAVKQWSAGKDQGCPDPTRFFPR